MTGRTVGPKMRSSTDSRLCRRLQRSHPSASRTVDALRNREYPTRVKFSGEPGRRRRLPTSEHDGHPLLNRRALSLRKMCRAVTRRRRADTRFPAPRDDVRAALRDVRVHCIPCLRSVSFRRRACAPRRQALSLIPSCALSLERVEFAPQVAYVLHHIHGAERDTGRCVQRLSRDCWVLVAEQHHHLRAPGMAIMFLACYRWRRRGFVL